LDHERAAQAKQRLEDRKRGEQRIRDTEHVIYKPACFVAVPRPPSSTSTSSSSSSQLPPSLSSLYAAMVAQQSTKSETIASLTPSSDPFWVFAKMK
jgi:hypothetical protein